MRALRAAAAACRLPRQHQQLVRNEAQAPALALPWVQQPQRARGRVARVGKRGLAGCGLYLVDLQGG